MTLGNVENLATDHGEQHLLAAQCLFWNFEEVVLKDDDVRNLALFE